MRRHRRRAPAAVDDLPSNTCGNDHGGEDKVNREGAMRRSGACASAGASRGEGEVGGAYRRRPLSGGAATVWSAL